MNWDQKDLAFPANEQSFFTIQVTSYPLLKDVKNLSSNALYSLDFTLPTRTYPDS